MSNLNELERLAGLKEKGFLSPAEFEKQKAELFAKMEATGPRKAGRGRWWKGFLALIGLAIVSLSYLLGAEPGGLPSCDSGQTKIALKNAIEDSPSSNLVNVKFIDLRDVTEVYYAPEKNERSCRGLFMLNSGEQKFAYRVFLTEPNAKEFFVEIWSENFNVQN
jgi:hypothetical protein